MLNFLSSKALIDLTPLQLECLFLWYERKIEKVRGNICDILTYMSHYDLCKTIEECACGDLYDVLSDKDCLYVCDDIVCYEDLRIFCHNYTAIHSAIVSYRRTADFVYIDRSVLRSLLKDRPLYN